MKIWTVNSFFFILFDKCHNSMMKTFHCHFLQKLKIFFDMPLEPATKGRWKSYILGHSKSCFIIREERKFNTFDFWPKIECWFFVAFSKITWLDFYSVVDVSLLWPIGSFKKISPEMWDQPKCDGDLRALARVVPSTPLFCTVGWSRIRFSSFFRTFFLLVNKAFPK